MTLAATTPSPGVRLLQVAGELDLLTAPRLTERVEHLLRDRPDHLVLDMSEVSFMGASGLRALVSAKDRSAQRGIHLHVTGTRHRAVAKPLQIVRLDQLLATYPTWEDAVDIIVGPASDAGPGRADEGAALSCGYPSRLT